MSNQPYENIYDINKLYKFNGANALDPFKKISLKLKKANTNSKWIYCNYPEALPSNCGGDFNKGNRCLNQVLVEAGTHYIFYSYHNAMMTSSIGYGDNGLEHFGIQIYNPNSASAADNGTLEVSVNRLGHHIYSKDTANPHNPSFDAVSGVPWTRFFDFPSYTYNVVSGGVYWMLDEQVNGINKYQTDANNNYVLDEQGNRIFIGCRNHNETTFSGVIEFTVDKPAVVTVYLYDNKSNINGTATVYPSEESYPNYHENGLENKGIGEQITGYANYYGYESDGTIEFKVSDLINNVHYFNVNYGSKQKAFDSTTGNMISNFNADNVPNFIIDGVATENDMIPITRVYDGVTVTEASHPGHLGNWGAMYKLRLKITNDTDYTYNVHSYVHNVHDNYDQFIILKTSEFNDYARINNITNGVDYPTGNAWRWLAKNLAAGETYQDDVYYVCGTNSTPNSQFVFSVAGFEDDINPVYKPVVIVEE